MLGALLPSNAVKVITDVELRFHAVKVLDGKAAHDTVRSLQIIIQHFVRYVDRITLLNHGLDDEVILHALSERVTKLLKDFRAIKLVPGNGTEHSIIGFTEELPEILMRDQLIPRDL